MAEMPVYRAAGTTYYEQLGYQAIETTKTRRELNRFVHPLLRRANVVATLMTLGLLAFVYYGGYQHAWSIVIATGTIASVVLSSLGSKRSARIANAAILALWIAACATIAIFSKQAVVAAAIPIVTFAFIAVVCSIIGPYQTREGSLE